jgi:hypothetical protein
VKLHVSVSVLSLVSSLALAETAPAAAPAAAAPAAAAPAAAAPATKVSMRVQLDPFYKNLNNASKNFKTPKLDSLRLMFERDLGQNSKADIELRLHELENSKKTSLSDSGKLVINTDVIKYYHLLFKIPGVDGLELGFVREIEPGLYGFTDKIKGSNVTESVAFTGHLGRVEGYRAAYNTGWSDLKLTYHLARNPHLDDKTFGTKPTNTTWYHKLTSDFKVEGTPVQVGIGSQGKWLALNTGSKLKYDSFFHVLAEHKMDDMKIKAGVAYDTYATVKKTDSTAATNVATTYLVGTKYDLLPKEFSILAELNYRTLKSANSDRTDFSSSEKKFVDSANETAFTLAGQYMLDDKLSFIPSYSYYLSNRSQAWVDNSSGAAFESDRTILKGSDGKAAKNEQALGLRVRYDY